MKLKKIINYICIFRHCLEVVTNIILDNTFKECVFSAPGFLLSVHGNDELPQFSNDFIFIPNEQTAKILIKPTMMTTSDGLRRYAPHVRNCYFRSERKLRFFKSYSKKKCDIECLANFTRNECGCVRYYTPSKHLNWNLLPAIISILQNTPSEFILQEMKELKFADLMR